MKPSRAPEFWWRRHSLTGYALAPLGALYGRASARRMAEPGISVGIPIICIGNFVVGGAGKTPTAIEVASVCRGLGIKPGFLSRGYMAAAAGPILVAPAAHTARDVGDEPLLLALHAPTVVAADRVSGARLLASLGVDAIVMDDGFQNPSLVKDLSLVLLDAGRGTGNGRVFPAGPLRAPLAGADPPHRRGRGDGRGAGRRGRARRRPRRAADPAGAARAAAPAGAEAAPLSRLCRHRRPAKVLCLARRLGRRDRLHDGFPRPPLVQRRGMREDPGAGEAPRPRADHHREGPRAAARPRRRGRAPR